MNMSRLLAKAVFAIIGGEIVGIKMPFACIGDAFVSPGDTIVDIGDAIV